MLIGRIDLLIYLRMINIYICPEGMELSFSEYTTKNDVKYKRYKGTPVSELF